MKPEIIFLKQEDVIEAGLLDMKQVLKSTEHTFDMLGKGNVIQPNKIFLGIPNDENWTSYGMSMPAYIKSEDGYSVIGFKWAAESMYNAQVEGVPYGIDIILLSNPKTMFPKAIMDGTIITAMRTSAAAGVCAKYNAKKDTKKLTLFGAGVIGRTMIESIMTVIPGIKEVTLVDKDIDKAIDLKDEFKGKYNIVTSNDAKSAVADADLVVTETTSRKAFIKKKWLKKNATVIQMEAHAFERDVMLSADKVVLDSWEQMSHLSVSEVKSLHDAGLLNKEDIIEIKDIVTGKENGRENEDQFVMCATFGMGCVDIAIADMLYKNAVKQGLGVKLNQWDNPIWV